LQSKDQSAKILGTSPSQQEPVMKRILSLVGALFFVIVALVYGLQNPQSFPPLDWAKKAAPGKPRVAVLLEFGQKDINLRDWSGQATITGAKVVQREGYRFRAEDKLTGSDGWTASTHRPVRAPAGMPAITKLEPVATVGVVLHVEDVQADAKVGIALKTGEKADVPLPDVLAGKTIALWNGTAVARLLTTASPVAIDKTEDDMPAAAYGPDGTLWVAYVSYKHRDETRRLEAPTLKDAPTGFKAYYKPEFADQVVVKSFKAGKWSEPIPVTDAKQDIARCAIAVTSHGAVVVVYSAHRQSSFDLYARLIDSQGRPGQELRLTTKLGNVLSPVAAADAAGRVWVAAQAWYENGHAGRLLLSINGDGNATEHFRIQMAGGNTWHPAIAVSPNGKVAVAYDVYSALGSYDVHLDVFEKNLAVKSFEVATSPKFEARPSIAYDPSGRLWIAYEEGPENWGKDYGSLVTGKGSPLYSARSVRVVCLDTDGKLKRPTAELPTSTVEPPAMAGDAVKTNLFERASRYAYPKIGLDGDGRVWLTYRRNFGSRYSSHPGAYWLTYARRLDGQAWSDEIEVHHSDGLLDHRPVLLPHPGGGLLIVHNTDGRYTTPNDIDNQIYASVIDLPAKAIALTLVAHQPGDNKGTPELAAENAAVKRMREHRIKAGGKTYQFLRGEYHRHTEISWDGAPDGSLEDMFRYAIDAVQFDWIGNGDHDNGAGREYPWWLTQKFTDAYQSKAFTTMFTYERSVAYPHGHRNVMFAQRGILTLPRLDPPAGAPPLEEGKKKGAWPGGVHPDDTKMLYRYLHEFGGICASHTSATGMGTDWRDNDPVVEPIVEIYQGDRMSYEMEGAPRAGYDPQSGKQPANVAGWFPKGFVNLALQKGHKLAFQASSDHWSTHISFFIILAEARDRQSLLKAVKQRHCYAATDNILVDFRCGDAIMGDVVAAKDAPKFNIHVVGTAKLAKIDILRDSEVVATLTPGDKEFKTEWTDPKAAAGTHYYYVRVLQADQEIAWGSPIWVEHKN
jgi:hypothetical protein